MQENSYTIKRYLEIYAANDQDIVGTLSEDFQGQGRDSEVPSAVAATWMISFDLIWNRNRLAADLMSLMACFDRQGIPQFLLTQSSQNPRDVDKALLVLIAFSFIRPNEQRNSYQIHRLVHLVMQKWLEKCASTNVWATTALTRVSDFLSSVDMDDASKVSAIVPHAQRVLNFECLPTSTLPERASVMHKLAIYFLSSGSLLRAEELGKAALKLRQAEFSLDHSDSVESLGTVASILRSLGQHEEATRMQMQVLHWRQQNLGMEHKDTLSSMNLLANIYQDLGDLDAAERLYEKVKALRLKSLSAEHPDVLSIMCDLASLYQLQNRLDEAEEAYLQNERAALKLFGAEHHRTLAIKLALSRIYKSQGHHGRAEALLRDTLSISKESPELFPTKTDLVAGSPGQNFLGKVVCEEVHGQTPSVAYILILCEGLPLQNPNAAFRLCPPVGKTSKHDIIIFSGSQIYVSPDIRERFVFITNRYVELALVKRI
jgi:tetratricopeptide (TPR) repeat protein